MPERYTEFLVEPTGKAPKNLLDSIRRVQNASFGFIASWSAGEVVDATETSREAFEHLDYIFGELLRQRDVQKQDPNWPTSPFNAALTECVGRLWPTVTPQDIATFTQLPVGSGALPAGATYHPLPLGIALTKMKHRHTFIANFSVVAPSTHVLFAVTTAGMGQPSTLVELDVPLFCSACKAAAAHV